MALTATASGEPTSSAVLDGRRVRFRPVAALRTEESWVDRPVRSPPCYPEWTSGASCLAYYENYRPAANFGRALQNSNLVQVILRDHGYDKVEAFEDEAWSLSAPRPPTPTRRRPPRCTRRPADAPTRGLCWRGGLITRGLCWRREVRALRLAALFIMWPMAWPCTR